jgi:AraC family cel operon transcriptional repressor
MIHIVNTKDTINIETETHYAFQRQINPAIYPQIHDFYEISFITHGELQLLLKGKTFTLKKGDIIFVRPGEIHKKVETVKSEHINLAFPALTVNSLFEFLYSDSEKQNFLAMRELPVIHLTSNETNFLKTKLERLAFLNIHDVTTIKSYLRTQLVYIFTQYLIPALTFDAKTGEQENVPVWFQKLVQELDNTALSTISLETLVNFSGKTKEHICRSFQKFLNTTPIAYINTLKLNYAANMLQHSDVEIVDIAYSLGFQSLSNFYAMFKKEFALTPLKFRKMGSYSSKTT